MSSHDGGKVWFVTGSSRGFGRVWAEAALRRGDRVVVTARDVSSVEDLVAQYPDQAVAMTLDVTDRAAVFAAVAQGVERFGRLDVVVANAGHGLFGALEETTEASARRQIEVNLFGVVWLLQAVAPILREQRHGHVLITSSFGGLISFPTAALYGASKYAVEGLGESFAQETSDFGVKVTLVEPAAYVTGFGSAGEQTEPHPAYDAARARTGKVFAEMPVADPAHTDRAVLDLVDMAEPPLRLLLGAHVLPLVVGTYEDRIGSWRSLESVAVAAQ
ncbi:SDR family NAD(P)-dependent oxidoreductase [Pseudonocardia sp. HH130629-09]|uniref:SDR family NAD(P)-dependent oxidoreductase n=1 Tax=Pseudonocardia sp. HH130629-09 TaxID=1641402 RepID=UPI0006CB0434|nr:SDR family NAD(P)-dependent oxidoreductase [Pseudonocardia sp. HH130629-09]ALE83522.1 short-chain dehydrogenase [Pseudonocardia sp. HH130629-09]